MFLFISGGEIFVILLVAIMVFGADKLPEIARELGKGMRQIKDATNDIKREIKNSAEKNDLDIDAVAKVRNEINKVKDNFGDFSNPMKKVTNDIENSLNPIKDSDGNVKSFFNKPKEVKDSIEKTITSTEEVKDVPEIPAISSKEVTDTTEDSNGPIKREK